VRLREDPLPPPQRWKFQLLLLEGRGYEEGPAFSFYIIHQTETTSIDRPAPTQCVGRPRDLGRSPPGI